jgi:chemotaxis methyl-accepting protein methylase
MAEDPRVSYRVHDVFQPWAGETPDVIKVANLLRRLYFPDADIIRALHVLRDSLPEGGHLMVVDNPRIPNTPPRAGIYRRVGTRLEEVARTGEPEIADLVEGLNSEAADRA